MQKILDNIVEHKDLLIDRPCPCCNKDDYKLVVKKDNLDIVQCNSCELIYVNPIFDEESYKKLYKSSEYNEIIKKRSNLHWTCIGFIQTCSGPVLDSYRPVVVFY